MGLTDDTLIQADNARMTILRPNHADQEITWKQTYTYNNGNNLTFSTFDIFRIKDDSEMTYPCRLDKCDQLCRDETQHIFQDEVRLETTDGNYVCSCTRDYFQDSKYPDQCHETPTCHHKTLMCDYDETSQNSAAQEVVDYKCITRDKMCDGTTQCTDGHDESGLGLEFFELNIPFYPKKSYFTKLFLPNIF